MPLQDQESLQISASVPPLFKCPISLDLMADPVSLCTGVTYDRASIEKWFDQGNSICPATGQVVYTHDLIPNHALRTLIHKWCVANTWQILQTPEPVAEACNVRQMLREIEEGTVEALRKLKSLAKTERNRRCLKSEGALPVLVRVLERFPDLAQEEGEAVQEAVGTIVLFPVQDVINLIRHAAIRTLQWVLSEGNLESKLNAAALVERLASADKTVARQIGSTEGFTDGLLSLFKQNLTYPAAVKVSLKALLPLCSVIRNRAKIAKDGGVVPALIELLPGAERSVTETSLAILEAISTSSQGRCALMAHALAVPTVVRNLVVVSDMATDYAVRILLAICFNCGEEELLREVVEMGTFEKLLLLMQIECGQRTKQNANRLLRILSPLRDNDSCIDSSTTLCF